MCVIICAPHFSGERAAVHMGLQQQPPVRQHRSYFFFDIICQLKVWSYRSCFALICRPSPIIFMCFSLLLDLWGYSSKMPKASHTIGSTALRSPAKPARVICKFNFDISGSEAAQAAKIIQVTLGLCQSCHIRQLHWIVNYTDPIKQFPLIPSNNSRDRCPVVPILRWQ